ncbi:MAG: OmpA family protein [Myxococcales bacterium]|nr:OmpA family protein [Myxococcales bacterium]
MLLLSLASACSTGGILQGRIDGLRDIVEQAERNGAYRCAPRELALAQAHMRFAEGELHQGDAGRAEEHLAVAEPNGRAAMRLSPPERCAPAGVVIERPAEPPPPPPPPPPPGDRDGDGYIDPEDECPDDPEDFDAYEDQDGCPEDQDTDGDGLPDSRDLCVLEPEDTDGFADTDGCPEPDNDVDGRLDAVDRCANDPEDMDGFNDEDGCPDLDNDTDGLQDHEDRCPNEAGPRDNEGCPRVYADVEVTSTHIRITQTVHFEFDRAVIQDRSFELLNTVAQVMQDFPDIAVEVQGHTDSRGNDGYNLRLSQARAEAVVEYLVGRGIGAQRMTARGYGETRPIESNRRARGRAANRRVEFVRTDAAAEQAPPPGAGR